MKLTKVDLSRNALAIITSSIMASLMMVGVATAQPKPSCFMVDTSGEVIDLTNICDRQPRSVSQVDNLANDEILAKKVENSDRESDLVYFVGDGELPFSLNTSSRVNYLGNRPTYIRRYRKSYRLGSRNGIVNNLPESRINHRHVNNSDHTPFFIYRYKQ